MKTKLQMGFFFVLCLLLSTCGDSLKRDSEENTPTSGKLNVYYDEGLARHVINQTLTFESQYPHAQVKLFAGSEDRAVQALYQDQINY